MHDLESKIAAWRTKVTAALPPGDDLAEELEAHVRDQIDALVAAGMAGPAAFEAAVGRLGDPAALAREFERVPSTRGGRVRAREFRLLAYSASAAGFAGFVWYAAIALFRTVQFFSGKPAAPAPGFVIYWTAMAWICAGLCAVAMQRGGRFLGAPTRGDARSIVAFNLLVVWILFSGWVSQRHCRYELQLALIGLALVALTGLWRAWLRQGLDSGPAPATAE